MMLLGHTEIISEMIFFRMNIFLIKLINHRLKRGLKLSFYREKQLVFEW